jgi:chromatin segregation and condensation protein Rec8/ScpA/Scc1 (kleisin family)
MENLEEWTVKELKEFCNKNNIKVPSKAKKKDIIVLVQNVISHPDFVDRTQIEEELEEELIAGVEEEHPTVIEEHPRVEEEPSDLTSIQKEKLDAKFWQTPKYRVLLDLDLAKDSDVAFYDLASLIDEFFNQMLKEDIVNYKISGIALRTSANLHHYKISSIIREEEEIQKKEEIEKLKATHSRTIPTSLPQPIHPKMTIATKDELFEAMRAAIIETMQKKEKLRRQRLRREEIKQKRIQRVSQAKLPKELLKHITGKEQTVEELHESWYNRIKATTNLDNRNPTFFELLAIIKNEEENAIDKKFAFIRMFLALMFLSSGNRLILSQSDEFKDIQISLK